jgi:hypothetical protein
MQRILILLVIATLFAGCKKDCPCEPTHCETTHKVTFQPNQTQGNDVTANFHQGTPSSANDNGNALPELAIYAWTNNGAYVEGKAYVSFNELSGIPSGAIITSAKLSLFGVSSSGWCPQGNIGDNSFLVQRVTSSWAENTLTWNSAPTVTTSNQVSFTPAAGNWNVDAVITVTDLVQNMIDENKPYGFCMTTGTKSPYRSVIFASSEVSDAAKRPKLEVTYTN